MRIAIFTAICGAPEPLKVQPPFPGVEFLCFSDQKLTPVNGWKIIPVSTAVDGSPVTAERVKVAPHHYLDEKFEKSIWIDSDLAIQTTDFVDRCIGALQKWGIACMRPPSDYGLYQEAKLYCNLPQCRRQRVIEQAAHYRMYRVPPSYGFAACEIIVRDMKNPLVRKIGDEWLYEILVWTSLVQISLCYVLYRNRAGYDPLPFQFYDRSVFHLERQAHS